MHHSQLKGEFHHDPVIIGASSAKQLESNLVGMGKGCCPRMW
jgi:hypothetical protein